MISCLMQSTADISLGLRLAHPRLLLVSPPSRIYRDQDKHSRVAGRPGPISRRRATARCPPSSLFSRLTPVPSCFIFSSTARGVMLPSPDSDGSIFPAAHNAASQASGQSAVGSSTMTSTCAPDRSPHLHPDSQRPRKRLRTRKACAYCKARKIRCDFDGLSTPGDPCKRCQTYGLACDVICEVGRYTERTVSRGSALVPVLGC